MVWVCFGPHWSGLGVVTVVYFGTMGVIGPICGIYGLWVYIMVLCIMLYVPIFMVF